MSQPSGLVDFVLAKLAVRYGVLWSRMWEDVPPEAVKSDWQSELHGMPRYCIEYALGYLPTERPPTVGAFKALCQRAPAPSQPRLVAPLDKQPATVRRKVESLRMGSIPTDGLRWARRLREREDAGERLSLDQREAWRRALRRELAATA